MVVDYLRSADLKGPRTIFKILAGNRLFGTQIGPNTRRNQTKNARGGAYKPEQTDSDDPKLLKCEIAQLSPSHGHARLH